MRKVRFVVFLQFFPSRNIKKTKKKTRRTGTASFRGREWASVWGHGLAVFRKAIALRQDSARHLSFRIDLLDLRGYRCGQVAD